MIKTEFVEALEPQEHPGDIEQTWHGRLRAKDKRSKRREFRMAEPTTTKTFRNYLVPDRAGYDVPLNQGPTPACTGFGFTHLLLAHNVVNHPIIDPHAMYEMAKRHDEWPGESYDGSSTNGVMKAGRELGLITGWVWAWNVETVARHILERGPTVWGTDWTVGMDDTDAQGYVWPAGSILGGHLWACIGVNTIRKNPDGSTGAFRCLNSWGEWGDKDKRTGKRTGRFWLSFQSAQKLLDGLDPRWPGEAAALTEIKVS